MSASARPNPSPSLQDLGANQFTLQDADGTTQITFNPTAPGPLIAGQPVGGSRLEYTGEEGSFTFSADQVQSQDSPLGRLVSVVLQPNGDTGALTFTLVLPCMCQSDKSQSLKALGIKTQGRGSVTTGADRTYKVLQLDGAAATVAMPL